MFGVSYRFPVAGRNQRLRESGPELVDLWSQDLEAMDPAHMDRPSSVPTSGPGPPGTRGRSTSIATSPRHRCPPNSRGVPGRGAGRSGLHPWPVSAVRGTPWTPGAGACAAAAALLDLSARRLARPECRCRPRGSRHRSPGRARDGGRCPCAAPRRRAARHRRCPSAGAARRVLHRLDPQKAYAKALGTGLADDLSKTYLGTDRRRNPSGWSLTMFSVVPGYVGAVAAETARGVRIRTRRAGTAAPSLRTRA